jgi:hypothetical protein
MQLVAATTTRRQAHKTTILDTESPPIEAMLHGRSNVSERFR